MNLNEALDELIVELTKHADRMANAIWQLGENWNEGDLAAAVRECQDAADAYNDFIAEA